MLNYRSVINFCWTYTRHHAMSLCSALDGELVHGDVLLLEALQGIHTSLYELMMPFGSISERFRVSVHDNGEPHLRSNG